MSSLQKAQKEAKKLALLLKKKHLKVVFAESCTGGMVSALLAQIPGISEHLCGSAVVYRNTTKHKWLEIPQKTLKKPGAVSAEVAIQMAVRILDKTPEADICASVTGHLGPNAPRNQDGLIYMAMASRAKSKIDVFPFYFKLSKAQRSKSLRVERQLAASLSVIQMVRSFLA